jgi:hypothetical protein
MTWGQYVTNLWTKAAIFKNHFKNYFKIINHNLHELEVFTPGLASLKWEKVNICFVLVIYTIKWNQAVIFIKKPKFIVSLTQSDKCNNSVGLHSTKQLNL